MSKADHAAQVIAAVRSRGSDADHLRDAAHEAHHALSYKVKSGKWDRETIHQAIIKDKMPGRWVVAELEARAVEQLVCAKLDVRCGSVEHWATIAWMEAMKGVGLNLHSPAWIAEHVHKYMKRSMVIAMADAVMALKPWKPRGTKKQPLADLTGSR